MGVNAIPFPEIDAGVRWTALRNALSAHAQVQELGARLDAGDRAAAIPLRRALQRRSRFEAVAVAFGADPDALRQIPTSAQPSGSKEGVS